MFHKITPRQHLLRDCIRALIISCDSSSTQPHHLRTKGNSNLLLKMTKPFQWTLWSGIASFSLRILANAASTDKESEVESILQKLESDVRAFRDEIERVYGARCKTETLTECYKSSFNVCDSTFPNQQCLKADEFVMSTCGDGVGCNGECVHEDTPGLNLLHWHLSTKSTNG